MRTNKAKYDYFYGQIESVCQNFIDQYYQWDVRPYAIYLCTRKEILELPIYKIDLYTGIFPMDKPTNKDIERIQAETKEFIPDASMIRLHYRSGTGTGAYSLDAISKQVNLSLNSFDLLTLLQSNIEKYAERDGYEPCQRCGVQTKIGNVIVRSIGYRTRNSFGKSTYATKEMRFCSGDCATYEQYAMEG